MLFACVHCETEFECGPNTKYCSSDCHFEHLVVKKRGCWDSRAKSTMKEGYIRIKFREFGPQGMLFHRFSYQKYCGPIPIGLFVLHKCDNPRCSNPKHLFLGDNGDNVRDAVKKGRHKRGSYRIENHPEVWPRGETHHSAKLKETQVVEIIRSEAPIADIAVQYGISKKVIHAIRARRIWKQINLPPSPRRKTGPKPKHLLRPS